MKYNNTRYLVEVRYFRVKSFEKKIKGKTRVMYKDMNKGKM